MAIPSRLGDLKSRLEQAAVTSKDASASALSSVLNVPNTYLFNDYSNELDPIIEGLTSSSINIDAVLTSLNLLNQSILNKESTDAISILIACLNAEKERVDQTTLSPETEKARSIVLGRLNHLKLSTAGFLTATSKLCKAHPFLTAFNKSLDLLFSTLLNPNSSHKEFLASIEQTHTDLVKLLKNQEAATYMKELSTKDKRALKDLETNLLAYQRLPFPLQRLICSPKFALYPSVEDLSASIADAKKVVYTQINSQQANVSKILPNPAEWVEVKVKELIPKWNSQGDAFYTPFESLSEALVFFSEGVGKGYTKEDQTKTIIALIRECDLKTPGFEKSFLTKINEANPTDEEDWSKKHLLDSPRLLKKALTVALKAAAKERGFTSTPTTSTQELLAFFQGQKTFSMTTVKESSSIGHVDKHSFFSYVDAALNCFNRPGSITQTTAALLGQSFCTLLESSFLTSWINKQDETTKLALKPIIYNTIGALKSATSISDYKKAFANLKAFCKENHIILGSLEISHWLDSESLEKQTTAVEEVDATFKELRILLDDHKPSKDPGFDWDNGEALAAKISEERDQLAINLKDQLTYKLIYEMFLKKNDTSFHDIKKGEKDLSAIERKEHFLKELKKEINQSDLGWITKKTTIFFLPFLYTIIGRYTSSLLKNFDNDVTGHLDSINKTAMLSRSNNCFAQYNALLKAWADVKEGGDKNTLINAMMKNKQYLKYGNKSYSQGELYTKVSDSFINNYFDLYKGQGIDEDRSISSYLSLKRTRVIEFVKRPVFENPETRARKVLNGLAYALKAVLIGAPIYLVVGLINIPFKLLEVITNRLVKSLLKKTLGNFEAIENLVAASKDGIYVNNPYVYAITSFFADQLESLSKELTKPKTNEAVEQTEKQPLDVADNVRKIIKTTFESLLEILDKNQFNTQEQLDDYLKNNKTRIDAVKDALDAQLLPLITEGCIDITLTASKKLLTKESLQKPICLLYENLNEILLSNPTKSPEEIEIEQLKNLQAQEKLKTFSEKILNQAINTALDSFFEDLGRKEGSKAKRYLSWLRNAFAHPETGLLNSWDAALDQLTAESSEKNHLEVIEQLLSTNDKFLVQFELKKEQLDESPSTTTLELKEKTAPIIKNLVSLLGKEDQGLTSLYQVQSTIYKIREDQPYFTSTNLSFADLKAQLIGLEDDFNNNERVATINQNFDFLKETLRGIETNNPPLLSDPLKYSILKEHITAELTNREALAKEIKGSLNKLRKLDALSQIQRDPAGILAQLQEAKRADLAHGRFNIFNRGYVDRFTPLYNELYSQINDDSIPEEIKTPLKVALRSLKDSRNNGSIELAVTAFNLVDINAGITLEKDTNLIINRDAALAIDRALSKDIQGLCASFTEELEGKKTEYEQITGKLRERINITRESVASISDISFLYTETGVSDAVKGIPHKIVYSRIKPKLTGIFDLLRDGNFAQFFINHALLMPFVER